MKWSVDVARVVDKAEVTFEKSRMHVPTKTANPLVMHWSYLIYGNMVSSYWEFPDPTAIMCSFKWELWNTTVVGIEKELEINLKIDNVNQI